MRHLLVDTMLLAKRNLLRFRRSPELVVGFLVQPIMFILLFVYVLGGAIETPGFDYVDFLMPGIIVQTIAFGGFVTAIALAEDLKKGLIDRFRSLPIARSSVLAGRTVADIVTNAVTIAVMIVVGLLVGFNFDANLAELVGGILLLLLMGYAFSWIYALLGLASTTPEAAQQLGFILIFPLTFASSAFVPVDSMPSWLEAFADGQPVHGDRRRDARAVDRHSGRQQHLGRRRLVRRPDRGLRPASDLALQAHRQQLSTRSAAAVRRVPPSDRRGGPLVADDVRDRVDQGEVGEGLREVAEVAARGRVELLGVEAERARVLEQPLAELAAAPALADLEQRRDEPERADQEGPLLAGEAVVGLLGAVAEHEAVLGQLLGDRQHRRAAALVALGQEADERDQQVRGVERLGLVVLGEDAA